ncbi:alpha-N-acetylgalactosamine-specific lectin-like [Leucoraja erinacea]|uniref:alpha-N-acetylgalactosamine-specific lectin-like n=1 Tax=Leucoraja erinaceus TaxID=7782 RepID=UPI0024585A95|nr:alpha-N-acetylgalactosamine-specific lectin-like [Leucoraja erinacea]
MYIRMQQNWKPHRHRELGERRFEEGNMMLVWVLVLAALLASDVTGANNSTEPEETLQNLGCHGPCLPFWHFDPCTKTCYRFFNQKLPWACAEHHCRSMGSRGRHVHLASIMSCHQNSVISHLIRPGCGGIQSAWIGLNDRCCEGHFKWIDGSAYSYSHFACGEPNNSGNEDCVETNFNGVGLWNDLSCNVRRSFVCSYRTCHN